jgi:iron(III) transport system ATP-binding protein
MDYLVDVDGTTLRTNIETHKAISDNLMFKDGDSCVVDFNNLHWFEAEKLREVVGADTNLQGVGS